MSRHRVRMFCGYETMANNRGQMYCNRQCSGFWVSRKPGAKKKKRDSAASEETCREIASYDPIWVEKGTRRVTPQGYVDIYVYSKEHKRAFFRREHTVIWAMIHQQELPRGWCIHHIDGNRANNNPENLLAMPRGMHNEMHWRLEEIDRNFSGVEAVIKGHELTNEYKKLIIEMREQNQRWFGKIC